ncbi:MAG TPA: hypothetical protein DCQ06_10240, partial [Myxococcales bacterium]|nr:hypothetical protein [Myxococcales bacterium]
SKVPTLREGLLDFDPVTGQVRQSVASPVQPQQRAERPPVMPASPWADAKEDPSTHDTVGRLPSMAMEAIAVAEERKAAKTFCDPDLHQADQHRVIRDTAPWRCSSKHWDISPMVGSTVVDAQPSDRRLSQRSLAFLKLRIGHRVPGTEHSPHQMELRLMYSYDGKEVQRYNVFVDPETFVGYPGGPSGARFSLTLRERFVVTSTAARVAQVHFVFSGSLTNADQSVIRFDGTCILKGDGKVSFSQPHFDNAQGRAVFGSSSLTLGLW